ncbi:MAG: aminopeptidase [Anaerolineales bacterium]|nr:MAG: aminopeptidase [Chloroflexota bacterium]MBE7436461.1 aminopeptidase [Anaerolineales bacterium]MCE7860898.1 aminopeptidase [Chloroflexi bacterium CFX2]MCK6581470.1 aminopeptidase [Anaerolineales bacterium]GJQ36506.1 MAG: aminopeptidase [Anaerolineaceae bacterium]
MTGKNHQEMLAKYAEAIVKVGLNIRAGQRLIIMLGATRGVPHQFAPLVREIAKAAYGVGAKYVEAIFADEEMLRLRAQHAPKDSFDIYPKWQIQAALDMIEHDGALLSIAGSNPDLLGGLDADIVGQLQKTHIEHWNAISEKVTKNAINWCVVAAAGEAWAQKIFPDLSVVEAQEKLWRAIFETTRIDQPDPIEAWNKHIASLRERALYLQAKQYTALHYKGPGTDFTLGLPSGHLWISAQSLAQNGIAFTANMPTEEVFTLPDRNRADGVISATFPLSYGGTLIEDFQVTFENGRITRVTAKKGEAALKKLVDTDEGSHRLGEVALVPASSPIGRRGHLFYNTLFDENASCHIAIGRAYRFTLAGGTELNDEEFIAAGGNVSLNHVDFMIGSPQMDIDGITKDGAREPVMRKGEWAIKV